MWTESIRWALDAYRRQLCYAAHSESSRPPTRHPHFLIPQMHSKLPLQLLERRASKFRVMFGGEHGYDGRVVAFEEDDVGRLDQVGFGAGMGRAFN